MPANLFTKSLHDQRRALLGWSIGVGLTVIVMSAVWPSFSGMDVNSLLAQYPQALKELFNVTDMTTGSGYLNAELFSLMLPAMFVVFAVGRGARLVAGEEEDGTLDVLATMPHPRRTILLQKAAALAAGIGVLAVVLLVTSWSASVVFGLDVPIRSLVDGAVAMFLLGTELGLVALAIGAVTGRRSVAIGASAAVAGVAYLLYLLAQLLDSLRPLRVVSPFYQAISEGPVGPTLPPIVWATLAVGVVAVAVSVPVFERRDLAV